MSVVIRRILVSVTIALALVGLLALGVAMLDIPAGLRFFSPSKYSFTPAEFTLPPCVDRTPIIVADLARQPRSTCDPTGIELVLPDGHRMTVQPPLAAGSESTFAHGVDGPTYSTVNYGIYGVCVAKRSGDNKTSWWWGRAEAIKFCQEYGKDAPTNNG